MAKNKNNQVENVPEGNDIQPENANIETSGPSFSIIGDCTFKGENPKTDSFKIECVVDGKLATLIDDLEESTEKTMLIYLAFYVLKIQAASKIRSAKLKAIDKNKSFDTKDAQEMALETRLTIGANNDPVKRKENTSTSYNRMTEEEQEKWMEEKGYVKVG